MRVNYNTLTFSQLNKIIKTGRGNQKAAARKQIQKRVAAETTANAKRIKEFEKTFAKKRKEKRETAFLTRPEKNELKRMKAYALYKKERNADKKEKAFLEYYKYSDKIDVIEDFLIDKKSLDKDDELRPMYAYRIWQMINDNQYSMIVKYIVLTGTAPNVFIITEYTAVRFVPKLKDNSQVLIYNIDGRFIKEL